MAKIHHLDQDTVHQIAAGEVVERPSAVVKELVENAIDAGAKAITIEIKQGGISFIRITDNGTGIAKEEIPIAFERYATSKIQSVDDLFCITSLGFRGEALSSIAAVAQVELVTKTADEWIGSRYIIEGGEEKQFEEIGCPEGTTFLIRNLFYNIPARKKFLKSAATEASYIGDLIEHLAISHPEVSFKFVNNNQIKLHTSGNGNLKEALYHIYGREVANHLLSIEAKKEESGIFITGFIGKPMISRGNRNFENYFINGRYVKSALISKAIEEAYKSYLMSRKYPFTALFFQIDTEKIDVNVHPTKMEVRFIDGDILADYILESILETLKGKELIPEISFLPKQEKTQVKKSPEPFEKKRMQLEQPSFSQVKNIISTPPIIKESLEYLTVNETKEKKKEKKLEEQEPLLDLPPLLSIEAKAKYRIIGQIFSTYWILEYQDKVFVVDQHAAHEKVLYEHMKKVWKEKELFSQVLEPPIIISIPVGQEHIVKGHLGVFKEIGFEIEPFGGKEYAVKAVPIDILGISSQKLLLELIDSFSSDTRNKTPEILLEKMASLSCKAAVKGNHTLSFLEIEKLMEQLFELENPYHCPHGRPTFISIRQYEIEKKFKRV